MSWPAALTPRFLRRKKPEEAVERAFDPPQYFSAQDRRGIHGDGYGSQPSDLTLIRNFKSWQAIAAKARADRVSTLELQVIETRQVRDGTVEDEVIDGHPLYDTWQKNPVFDEIQLLKLCAYWLTQNGAAYFLKVTDRLRFTRELWPMSPACIEIVGDPDVVISGYVYHGQNTETFYEANEVVHIWDPDPAAPFLGLGTIGPQAMAFDAGLMQEETIRQHYKEDAIPKVALKAQPDSVMPEQKQLEAFQKALKTSHHRRMGTASGLPATLPPGFDVHEFSGLDLGDQPQLMNELRDRILMANGVPRSVLGDVVDANRAAAETNQYVFDQHTILPLARMISSAFTRQLAMPEYGDSISVRFDEFVSSDKAHELAKEKQDLETKVRSINLVRADRGEDPVDWGEDPVGTFSDQPYRPDEMGGLEMDDPTAFDTDPEPEPQEPEEDMDEAEEEEPRSRLVRARPRLDWSPEATWLRFVRNERKWQPVFARAMREVFAQQRDATLERAEAYVQGDGTRSYQRDPIDDLFGDPEVWRRLFRRLVEPIRRRAFVETGQDVLQGLEDAGFDLTERSQLILANQGADLVTSTTRTTKRALRRELEAGVMAGESIDRIESRIRRVFRGRRNNSRTIARTEVQKATQQAHIEGFAQSEVVAGKQWNTSRDDAVRDSHVPVDGQRQKKEDPFILGDGERADAPGVGHGGTPLSAGNSINCRCFVTPTFWES